jgi:hypothetical protein
VATEGGAGTAGNSGIDGGEGGPGGALTVEGRVTDYWQHVIPGATVLLGAQMVVTGGDGKFKFLNVTAPYDVAVALSKSAQGAPYSQGWLYKGVTRTDPTLQVYRALAAHGGMVDSSSLTTTINGVTLPLADPSSSIKVAFGSVDGTFQYEPDAPILTDLSDADWRGPSTTVGTMHALLWKHTGTSTLEPPTGYVSYDVHPLTLMAGAMAQITFNVAAGMPITTVHVTGSVTSSSTTDRRNDAYVVFSSGAIMQLVSQTAPAAMFDYAMPTLPNSSISVSAQQGSYGFGAFAVVHQDNLAAGAAPVALAIPDPVSLTTPFDAAIGVTGASAFAWSNPGKVSLVAFTFADRRFCVVSTETSAQVPKFAIGGLDLPANGAGTWSVEVHGPYATVDDATGPNGMLDPFAGSGDFWGPKRAGGSYTTSEERTFTTAP